MNTNVVKAETEPDPNQTGVFEVPKAIPQPRYVMLYSWWQNASGSRKFGVVEKVTAGNGSKIRTIKVKLLEAGDSNPFHYDIDEFWTLVDQGKLIEMVHNAIGRSPTIF